MPPGSWSAGQGTGSPVAGGSGSRVSSPTTGGIPTANSTGTTASLPAYRHVQFDGMLAGPQSSGTLQIPVGPMTRSVGLSVHGNSMSGPLPLVDQMALIDRDGATLARFGPLWD